MDKSTNVVEIIQGLDIVPRILDVICRSTGMGFTAVARVTDTRWICCASRDEIAFGLAPGGELEVESTLCHEIRQHHGPIVIPDVQESIYCDHHTPTRYGFRSYISVPIIRNDGSFFGTLCAIDPHPADVDRPNVLEAFKLYADLIAAHLDLAERAAATEASLQDEQSTAVLREQFIAVLGHDLRNPLASIMAGLRLLPKHSPNASSIGVIAQMNQSATRMAALIDNVLDFARGRLGDGLTLRKQVQPIPPIVLQVVEELQLAHIDRSIETHIDCKVEVDCDGGRIAQMLSNLVGNALTHGAHDMPVVVTAMTSNDGLQLSVSNGGRAIPADNMSKLFHPFSRGASEPSLQGLGLGLFISQEIARAHGGLISVDSADAGTRFTFDLPFDGEAMIKRSV